MTRSLARIAFGLALGGGEANPGGEPFESAEPAEGIGFEQQ
jgi:hypothetical protein